jgi:RNAse (barnase) inhibitor barstar
METNRSKAFRRALAAQIIELMREAVKEKNSRKLNEAFLLSQNKKFNWDGLYDMESEWIELTDEGLKIIS